MVTPERQNAAQKEAKSTSPADVAPAPGLLTAAPPPPCSSSPSSPSPGYATQTCSTTSWASPSLWGRGKARSVGSPLFSAAAASTSSNRWQRRDAPLRPGTSTWSELPRRAPPKRGTGAGSPGGRRAAARRQRRRRRDERAGAARLKPVEWPKLMGGAAGAAAGARGGAVGDELWVHGGSRTPASSTTGGCAARPTAWRGDGEDERPAPTARKGTAWRRCTGAALRLRRRRDARAPTVRSTPSTRRRSRGSVRQSDGGGADAARGGDLLALHERLLLFGGCDRAAPRRPRPRTAAPARTWRAIRSPSTPPPPPQAASTVRTLDLAPRRGRSRCRGHGAARAERRGRRRHW